MRALVVALLLAPTFASAQDAPSAPSAASPTTSAPAPAPGDAAKDGVAAVKAWLALVDKGEYGASWDASASVMRTAVTKEQWEAAMQGVRAPLGGVVSRTFGTPKVTTTLPGAPDGHYVVVTTRAKFEKKKRAVETLTAIQEADGTWRVGGYFIK